MRYKAKPDVPVLLFFWSILFTSVFGTCYAIIFNYTNALLPLIPINGFSILLGIHIFRMEYTITNSELIIKALFTHKIPKSEIIDVTVENGIYKHILFGTGVFCNNLRTRVVARTPKITYILSPENPDSFVMSLKE